jgi:hypothetical protein
MDLLAELHVVAARLALREEHLVCECCGTGRLILIDERLDPNFAILGLLRQTLKCDSPACGKLTIV